MWSVRMWSAHLECVHLECAHVECAHVECVHVECVHVECVDVDKAAGFCWHVLKLLRRMKTYCGDACVLCRGTRLRDLPTSLETCHLPPWRSPITS